MSAVLTPVLTAAEPGARYLAAIATDLPAPLVAQFDLLATAPGGVARLRELILTLAVQGKLVPQLAGDEPAEVLLGRIREEKARLVAAGTIRPDKAATSVNNPNGLGNLPHLWAWSTLATVGLINPRIDAPANATASFVQMSSIPVAFSDAHVSEPRPWRDIKSGFTQFADGDVGVAKITPCFENGKSTVFQNLSNGIGAGTTELHIVRPLCGIVPKFVLLYFKTPGFLNDGEIVMTGSAGQKRLPRSYFENKPFPLPPLAEQARIVARVDELMRLCDALDTQGQLEAAQHAQLLGALLGTLTDSISHQALAEHWQRVSAHFDLLLDRPEAVDALEQTILQLAVRGLLVPQDPNDEPASELLHRIRDEKARLTGVSRSGRKNPPPEVVDVPRSFEAPAGWDWVPIEVISIVGTGTTPSRDNPAFFASGTIPWVTSGETCRPLIDSTGQHVTEAALAQTSLTIYPAGTLIVAMYGQGKTRGQVSELGISATTNQACAAIALIERSAWHRRFVKLVFEKSYDEIRQLSAGGAQPNLNVGKVKETQIPLPPLAEQSRIVARVAQLRRLCTDLRQRLAARQSTQAQLAQALVKPAAG